MYPTPVSPIVSALVTINEQILICYKLKPRLYLDLFSFYLISPFLSFFFYSKIPQNNTLHLFVMYS